MTEIFETEYARVEYIPADNAVLLKWKKFCRIDDYRRPTIFAAELLHKHGGCDFIIDARRGFEDDKADVVWGFEVLLPYMAKSGCKRCVFILEAVNEIEGEMDLWTAEFMKYFKVDRVTRYEDALKSE